MADNFRLWKIVELIMQQQIVTTDEIKELFFDLNEKEIFELLNQLKQHDMVASINDCYFFKDKRTLHK